MENKSPSWVDVIDQIVWISGLYEKVFWKLLNKLVYDTKIDDYIQLLWDVFWYKDTKHLFSRKIERKEFKTLSNIIFRFQENTNEIKKD